MAAEGSKSSKIALSAKQTQHGYNLSRSAVTTFTSYHTESSIEERNAVRMTSSAGSQTSLSLHYEKLRATAGMPLPMHIYYSFAFVFMTVYKAHNYIFQL